MAEQVLLKIVYLLICRILGLIVVLARGNQAATAAMLVLRHENAVLQRTTNFGAVHPLRRALQQVQAPNAKEQLTEKQRDVDKRKPARGQKGRSSRA